MDKPIVHWCEAAPYRHMVMLVIGDPQKGLAVLRRKMKPPKDDPIFSDALSAFTTDAPFDNPRTRFCRVGKCLSCGGDSVMWFPRFPEISALVHECLHATQNLVEAVGVEDENGEAEAYLLTELVSYFGNVVAKDVKRHAKTPWTI